MRAGLLGTDNIGLTADLPRLTNLEYRTGSHTTPVQPGLQHNLVLELLNYQVSIDLTELLLFHILLFGFYIILVAFTNRIVSNEIIFDCGLCLDGEDFIIKLISVILHFIFPTPLTRSFKFCWLQHFKCKT